MNYQEVKTYLLSKPEAREDYPFGPDCMVPKVKGKMFATLAYDGDVANMNLKCDPNHAFELRDIFPAVKPGYHMNKLHWNTVVLDGSIPRGEIERMIDHSYMLAPVNIRRYLPQFKMLTIS
jgi:predicted DNA-binding protein (MmcQ/YjbR family)